MPGRVGRRHGNLVGGLGSPYMSWNLEMGEELPRREVHGRFGGSRQSGMTRAGGSDNLLLFSSPSGGRYGYSFDGWGLDGAFHYTGEGQVGDQVFVRGNAALRDHVERGLRPRLFEEVRRSVVRYLGEFKINSDAPWYPEEATDRLGDLRKVIVFRLRPVTAVSPAGSVGAKPPDRPLVRDVPVEAYRAETFQVAPNREPTTAERREADLVQRYTVWLKTAGGTVTRKQINLPDLGHALYTDLFDSATAELIEAKSSASRHHVRLAVGQLLDYGRHVEHKSRAVLLPSDPGADLVQLLHSVGVVCIYEDAPGSFIRLEP